MLTEKKPIHENIFRDIVRNTPLTGETIGELQDRIDTEYRSKIDAYGLKGYYEGDQDGEAKQAIDKFFEEKFKQ